MVLLDYSKELCMIVCLKDYFCVGFGYNVGSGLCFKFLCFDFMEVVFCGECLFYFKICNLGNV